jgi:hypothetical protein
MNAEQDKANIILAEIADLHDLISSVEREANQEMERLAVRYGERLKPFIAKRKELDKKLKALMKSEVVAIFDGADKVKMTAGILLHTKDFKVTIPRGALVKIEQQGWTEAVRIAKSVDRPVVEGWPEERLVVIGAKRKLVDQFGYEIT